MGYILLTALSNIVCFMLGFYVCNKATKIITIDKQGNVINRTYEEDLEPAIYITPEMELAYEEYLKTKRVDSNE